VADNGLTPADIVDAAHALLNEEGLDRVSLRRLAQRLGIKAPSLYWHFKDKSELLAAIIEKTFEEGLTTIPHHPDWQSWMRAFGEALWRAQLHTRDFNRLVATTDIPAAQLERTIARVRMALSHVDLEESEAMRIQSSVQALVLGWATFANAPYAGKLGSTQDFDLLVHEHLDLLIAGETVKLAALNGR
jgi:TetR/AcrR family tetracycline transcriptional repressor